MKILHLQTCRFIDEDVIIEPIIYKKSLIKILEKYINHYTNIQINKNNIIIKNLNDDSYLKLGLQKRIVKYMKPYFSE